MLVATIDSPTTSLLSAADAAQHLAQLRQAGVPAAMDLDPASLFFSAQVRAIIASIQNYQREFTSALSRIETEFRLRKRKKEALELDSSSNSAGTGGEVQHRHRRQWWWERQSVFESDDLNSSEQLDVDSSIIEASFTDLWTMTESLINWLLDLLAVTTLWRKQNEPSSSSSSREAAAIWETQQLAIENAATEVLNAYSKVVLGISQAQLKSEALWEAAGKSGVAEPLISTLVAGYLAFKQHFSGSNKGTSTNSSTATKNGVHIVTERLRSLIEEVAEASFLAIESRLTTSARHFALVTLATSESHSSNNNIGAIMLGVTTNAVVPPPAASLRLLLCCGMRWSMTLCAQCTQADTDPGEKSLQPHKILCCTAMAFAEALVERIQEMHPSDTPQPSSSVGNTTKINSNSAAYEGSRDSRLLEAWEILRSVGSTVIPQVFTAFEPSFGVSLHASQKNSAMAAATAIKKCSHQIESLSDGLIRTYLDRKLSLLDGIMEDFLSPIVPEAAAETGETVDAAAFTEACALVAIWKKNFAPTHARPIVWTLLSTLGGIRTELLAYSPFLCKDVMLEVLQGVVGGVTELLESGFIETSAPERVCQLWLDVVVLQSAVNKLDDDGDGVEADLEQLCTALENAFSSGLKRCGDENCSSYTPQASAPAGSGGGGSDWAVSMGDHRRWVQKVCDSEVKKADSVMKAFAPQQQQF